MGVNAVLRGAAVATDFGSFALFEKPENLGLELLGIAHSGGMDGKSCLKLSRSVGFDPEFLPIVKTGREHRAGQEEEDHGEPSNEDHAANLSRKGEEIQFRVSCPMP